MMSDLPINQSLNILLSYMIPWSLIWMKNKYYKICSLVTGWNTYICKLVSGFIKSESMDQSVSFSTSLEGRTLAFITATANALNIVIAFLLAFIAWTPSYSTLISHILHYIYWYTSTPGHAQLHKLEIKVKSPSLEPATAGFTLGIRISQPPFPNCEGHQ